MMPANLRTYTELMARREELDAVGVTRSGSLLDRNVCLDFSRASSRGGFILAEITLGFGSSVEIVDLPLDGRPWQWVQTSTPNGIDTLSMQMAGTFVTPGGKWRGCASGPFRLAAFKEKLFQQLRVEIDDSPTWVVVLESARAPDDDVFNFIREQATGMPPERVVICLAPVNCVAGAVQVAARCAECAMHTWKHHGWPLPPSFRVEGLAPIAPAVDDEMEMMARTNEAILEAGSVTVEVEGVAQDVLVRNAPQLCFSGLFPGRTFRNLLDEAGHFNKLPELAFAPSHITLIGGGLPVECGHANESALSAAWSL